jgi:flagellar operon protein
MDIRNNYISIEQMQNQYLNNNNIKAKTIDSNISFEDVLKEKSKTSELKFSKHADERLSKRDINLTSEQLQRLEDGTKKAGEKGIKESLMIMDDLAFIVNVKNNTVITAIDSKSSNENVFTNIDGAVIV